ncbi:hypothetical protein [Micromonospora sp. LOL_027]|uniref:hypothetical protein n=1 Tax=Micromonospora sp. LOL_027 TaxID=3345419 RepID=UPI003A88DDA4
MPVRRGLAGGDAGHRLPALARVVRAACAELPGPHRQAVFAGTARRVYRID